MNARIYTTMLAMVLISSICLANVCFGAESTADKEQAAIKAANAWLALVDKGEYAASWDQAAAYFQKMVPKDKWIKTMKGAREPLGACSFRELGSKSYATELPGAPDGEYVVLQFKVRYENKDKGVETVTPMLEKDGTWKVSGYYIR